MGPGLRVLMDYERVYLDTVASAKQFVEDYTAEQHSVQLTGWKQMIDGLDDQYFANRLNIELLLDDESAAMTTEAAMSAVDDSNRRIRQKFELDYVFVYSFLVNEIKKQPTCPEANLNQTIPVRSHMKLLDPRLSNHVPVLHSPQTFSSDSHNPEQLRPLTSKTTYAVNCPASSSYPCCSHHTMRLLMSHDRISTHTSPVVSRPLPVFLEIQLKQTSSHTHSSSLPSPSKPQSPLATCIVPINSVGARSVPASVLLQTVNIVFNPHGHIRWARTHLSSASQQILNQPAPRLRLRHYQYKVLGGVGNSVVVSSSPALSQKCSPTMHCKAIQSYQAPKKIIPRKLLEFGRCFDANPQLQQAASNFIDEFRWLNQTTESSNNSTAKLRIVFDVSGRVFTGPDNLYAMQLRFHLNRIALIADIDKRSPSNRIQTGNLLGFLWIKLIDGTIFLKLLRAKAKTTPTGRLKSSVLELSSTLRFEQLFHNVASRIEPKQIGSQLARWQNIIKKQLVGLQSITYSPSTTQPHTPLPDADLLETGVLPLRQPTTVVAGVSNTNSAH